MYEDDPLRGGAVVKMFAKVLIGLVIVGIREGGGDHRYLPIFDLCQRRKAVSL